MQVPLSSGMYDPDNPNDHDQLLEYVAKKEAMRREHFAKSDHKPMPASARESLLDEAKNLVTGDRNNSYGPPNQDFERSAGQLNALGYRGPDGRPLMGHDIAMIIMAVKMSRLVWTPGKRDSWVDIAGYAACGYECTELERE